MIQYTEQPVFFERNRVWRVYKGGYLLGDFLGDKKEDTNYPEEWIASTVKALNEKSAGDNEGLSFIKGTNITLKELIQAYPAETLGNSRSLEILVKYLDSAIRLPLQAHPDRAFSEKYFNSSYGKTEMWLILATREDASICFGFKDKLTKERFSEIIEESKTDKSIMDKYLNRVAVNAGDVFLIPAKAVHAIGYGCLILEVQEPTDFTVQPEYWCGDHLLSRKEMYLDLEKDAALDCFDYSIYGEECIALSKREPRLVFKNDEYSKEALITKEDTPCFSVEKYYVSKSLLLECAPAIYVVAGGTGILEGKGYQEKVKKGDYFFLPKNALGNIKVAADSGCQLEIVACIPPDRG
ncbi:mannose-6-phosphate isomerase [Anaerotaenia torta]|uniref:class I mannose-6-phosphate isomerase n=1 Tax=Anaerotaenia torta TaxID=433293 RepID=UPI003D1B7F97